jgi:predicted DNA-binding transcriptional regulator AlpA
MTTPPPKLLSKEEMLNLIGNPSYPTVWKWMCEGKFPRAVVLGRNIVKWVESEVTQWVLDRAVDPAHRRKLLGDPGAPDQPHRGQGRKPQKGRGSGSRAA